MWPLAQARRFLRDRHWPELPLVGVPWWHACRCPFKAARSRKVWMPFRYYMIALLARTDNASGLLRALSCAGCTGDCRSVKERWVCLGVPVETWIFRNQKVCIGGGWFLICFGLQFLFRQRGSIIPFQITVRDFLTVWAMVSTLRL